MKERPLDKALQSLSGNHAATLLRLLSYGGMRSTIQFNIWQEDGVYTHTTANAPIATESSTFEELQENIRDAVATYFQGDDLQF
jgi:hypothetical protein